MSKKELTLEARLDKAQAYVIKAKHKATFTEAAKVAGLSLFHFHRQFKKRFGCTVKRYAMLAQIELAKSLIRKGKDLPDVAKACGFAHQSHLSRNFKRIAGKTPTAWRRSVGA